MASAGPSSSQSGPTLSALQRALQEASASIADFVKASSEWYVYHQACLPIVGHAWQDYQTDVSSQVGNVRGLRSLRSAVSKELQWVERHSAEVGSETVFTSSNSFYLTTSWQHVLYSALHQSPVVELDAYMATSPSSSKSTKVDIVCQGGKRWIRVLTIKPMSLLSEFRSAESYVVDDDDDDDDSSLSDGEGGKDHLSLDIINHQLARGEVDGIASQCSIMKVARELQMAADLAEKRNSWGRPMVEVALTRLSMDERGSSLQGKFYDDEEERRFEARIRAIDVEMQKMQLLVVSKTGRRLFREGEQDGFLPSSIASGEASLDERMCLLPRLAPPRKVKTPSPTATLNLDLSALVAFVSQISHIPLPHLSDADEVDKCFRKDHWKAEPQPEARTLDEEKTTADVEEEKGNDTQHARALRDQLRREMTTDTFFDAVLGHLEGEERLTLVCTKHVEEKFHEILSLVGGPTEQKRARSLFDEQGQDDFWKGSRWEGNSDVRSRIVLPVRSVAFSASDVSLPSSKNDSFECLARHSVQEGLKDLLDPASSSHGNVGTGVQRQTPHTLTSILYGLVHNCSTLTTNIASIKWLARDIQRHELAEACAKGHVENSYRASFASAVLFYPRSLAEKMMTSTYLPSAPDHNINITSFEWTGSTSRDDDRLVPRTPSDSYKETTAVRSSPTESVLEKAAISDSEGPHEALSQFERPVREKRLGGGYRATKRWLQGPRPRSALLIRHYRWWPLQPLEETWLRWTAPLAWKDPNQLVTRSAMQDVEEQHPDLPLRDEVACKKKDAWISGVARDWRRNRLHWIALALTFIGWAFGFTFLVKDLWYDASVVSDDGSAVSPSFFGCTTTFWTANSGCGLDGSLCAPFSSPTSVPFRCPASCETTTLGGARAVGDQLPSYVTLVVGGGHQGNSTSLDPVEATGPFIYRGDSFVCSAAIHAGVFSSDKGGCSSIWLNGAYSGYQGIERHGIQSTPFNSSFPLSYYFDENVVGQKCTDRSSRGYILDIILLAWTGFVLQPKRIVYFFTLVVVGFWHINFISEPREYPMSVGDPMGDFLPTLFIAYALWRLTFRFVWPAFERFPLERNVWIQGFYWMGVLLNVVFANVPLGRLVASQIASEPGALTSLIIIIVVVVVIALNQIRVIRKVGKLPKFLALSVVGGIIVGLLAAIPTTGLRLHHYIIAMVLLPYTAFPTRLSLIYSAFLLGMFLNGVGRWGYDGLIQDVATIRGSGIIGTGLPSFSAATNWTGVTGFGGADDSNGLVYWQDIPANQSDQWDSFQLLVDDVQRLQSSQTYFNISQLSQYFLETNLDSSPSTALSSGMLPASNLSLYPGGHDSSQVEDLIALQPHYLRLAYYNTNTGNLGDFTEAATLYFNGTFVSPGSGAT